MNRPPLRAVVFDRDGVLTQFDWAAIHAFLQPRLAVGLAELGPRWQRWGQAAGFPRTLDEEAHFWQGFWDHVCDDLSVPPAVAAELRAFDYTSVVRPYPDARPALLHARRRGQAIGVLSNFSLASLDASLAAAGLADLIDAACAATVVGAAKPDPRSYAAVLAALDVAPEATLFFDDEPACVAGAQAVGMQAYLVDRRAQAPTGPGVVRDLGALAALLEQSDHA